MRRKAEQNVRQKYSLSYAYAPVSPLCDHLWVKMVAEQRINVFCIFFFHIILSSGRAFLCFRLKKHMHRIPHIAHREGERERESAKAFNGTKVSGNSF